LHPFFEMICVLRGRHHLVMRGESLQTDAGHLLLYPPGVAHEEWSEPGMPFETVFISFRWAAPVYPRGGVRDPEGRIATICSWLERDRGADDPGSLALKDHLLGAALAEFVRATTATAHSIADDVRAFVRARLDSPIALDELAEVAGLSKFHFLRTYRQLTGRTPMEDVRRMRLEATRDLLLTTGLPLKAIAPRVGIESEHHLSRLIKEHYGLGARELRRRAAAPPRGPARRERARRRH
jgi:AraC-like DNA-binding protein